MKNFQELLAAGTISEESAATLGAGIKINKNAKLKDFNAVNTGNVTSTFKVGDTFKIVGIGIADGKVAGATRTNMPVFEIEDLAGAKRTVFASSLIRSTPTSNNEANGNVYDGDDAPTSEKGTALLQFDRGILQDAVGAFPALVDKLMEAGEYIRIEDIIRYTSNIKLQSDQPNGKAGDTVQARNVAYRLVGLKDKAEAKA